MTNLSIRDVIVISFIRNWNRIVIRNPMPRPRLMLIRLCMMMIIVGIITHGMFIVINSVARVGSEDTQGTLILIIIEVKHCKRN